MKKLIIVVMILFMAVGCAQATPAPTDQPTEAPPTTAPEGPTAEPTPEELVLEDDKLYLSIIWHQHQPVYYQDPETGVYAKPWVRVHASKDYLDMVQILEDYPDIRATYNLTPSLIRQLDDISAGAKDLYWVMAEIPAADLDPQQKQFILDRFFDINPGIIERFPRYVELAEMRDSVPLEDWTDEDFRDLQVLFNLAWTDPLYLSQEPLAALVERGEGFTEADKEILFAEHLRLVQEVIPYHAERQRAGQIEVTMTPFAHPILPLLVNTGLAREALPEIDLPPQFAYGQDAIAQVQLGVEFYQEHFGMEPRGMWPAEGSVAQSVVPAIAQSGVRWIATDEEVLAESLPDLEGFTRDGSDTVEQADTLYRPYYVEGTRGGPVAIVFRDKVISDLVGFQYSGMDGEAAADDLMARLDNIHEALGEEEGPHLVTILLDGENAWEFYENDGKEFLHGMYQRLSDSETIVTVTPTQYLDAMESEPERIEELHAGSWIDATYSTWIGEDEENLAWTYLLRTREALQLAIDSGELDEATQQEALELMYIAEGSDWFWWYGSDQNSGSDEDFDEQFRNYLERIYLLIGEDVPGFVYVPVIPQAAQTPDQQPADTLSVTVDGTAADEEWADAGLYEVGREGVQSFRYGFSQDALFLRLDTEEAFSADTTLGFYVNVPQPGPTNAYSRYGEGETLFGFGAKRLIEVTFAEGEPLVSIYEADGVGNWVPFEGDGSETIAVGDVVTEIGLPFTAFAPNTRSGDRMNVRMVLSEGEQDIVVVPGEGPALATVPDLPIPNVFLQVDDPVDDDHGPGDYTYPTDPVFTSGSFDMTKFTIGYDEQDVIFRVEFDGPVDNPWGSPNGLSIQTIDIYVDTDAGATGDRQLLSGRNAALAEGFAWNYAIWAEGWTPGVYAPGNDGPVQVDSGFTIITSPAKQRVTIRVPRTLLEGDPTEWAYAVTVAGQEGFPSAGVWRIRDVEGQAQQYRFGGGTDATNDTRLMDILVPVEADIRQEELLSDYDPTQEEILDDLPPDDFPKVTMVTPE